MKSGLFRRVLARRLRQNLWEGRRLDRLAVGAILLLYLALGIACGLVVPPFENLDEVEHFEVIRYIADHGQLPIHGTTAAAHYHYRQEASQPPLYHLLAAACVRLLDLETGDAGDFWRPNPWVACGTDATSLYGNRAVLYHNPHREAFPWHGALLALHLLRIASTLLQSVTVLFTYFIARRIGQREASLLAMAIVAFNPQFILVASGVNNDNLVTPLAAVGLYLLLQVWQEGLTVRRALLLGVVVGLAGLSKLSGWFLLALAALVVLVLLLRQRDVRPLWQGWLIPATALLVAGWWFWRNWQLYHDPTALGPMLELVGVRSEPASPLSAATLMFRSFWGQVPCAFFPTGFYVPYYGLVVLGLAGLAWRWRQLERAPRGALLLLLTWFLLIVAGWVRWDAMTPATGGRLWFPALPAVAIVLATGIVRATDGRLWPGRWAIAAALLLSAVWAVAGILPGFFAPPPRHADAEAVRPEHVSQAVLGERIRLLGYDLALDERQAAFDVTLYWQPLAPIDQDYVLTLQWVSSLPGDTTRRWNYDAWPGRGNYPTSAWQPGEVIEDRYRFLLPAASFPVQAWDLHLALYDGESGERLPIEVDGAVVDHLLLTRQRLPGENPSCPEEGRLTAAVRFGEAVALTHALVTSEEDGARVLLCWQALQPLPADYTVFVHLLDSSGALVDTGDGPPMGGAFPTSLWQPGDAILDPHVLATEIDAGDTVVVGLYRAEGGERLAALVDGLAAPNNAVTVWP